jgi:hypothetical protein
MAIWYNLWPFGIVCGHLLYFSQFGMFGPKKIWQPWFKSNVEASPLKVGVLNRCQNKGFLRRSIFF